MSRTLVAGLGTAILVAALAWHSTRPPPIRPNAPNAGRSASPSSVQVAAPMAREATPDLVPPPTGQPSTPERVSGKVVDRDGKPMSATVVAMSDQVLVGESHRVEAGADGAFSFPLPEGDWWVHAERGDLISQPMRASVCDGHGSDDLDLALVPASRVWGFVYDPEGRPVGGAQVLARSDQDLSLRHAITLSSRIPDPEPSNRTSTDLAGRYQMAVPCGRVVVQAEVDGLAVACAGGEVPERGDLQLDLRLARGFTPEGRVTDTAGRPIAGADVWVQFEGRVDWLPYPDHVQVATDSDGRYRAPVTWAGPYSASADKEGYVSESAELDEENPGPVDITLHRAGVIEGTVRMRGGALPPEGAQLGLRFAGSSHFQFAEVYDYQPGSKPRIGPDGAFRLERINPRRYVVQALVKGTALGESAEFDVAEGETVRGVVVELVPSCAIRGTVRSTATGAPLPRAMVGLVYRDPGRGSSAGGHASDQGGRFEIRDLAAGRYTIRASHGTLAPTEIEVELREGQVLEQDILLGEGARVRGHVRLDGAAMTTGPSYVQVQATDYLFGSMPRITADGAYETQGLLKGPCYVWINVDSEDPARRHRLVRLLDIGTEGDVVVDLDLRSAPRVRGTASSGGGPPETSAIAFVGRGSLEGWVWVATLGESGGFQANGLPPGDYVVIDGRRLAVEPDPVTSRSRIKTALTDPVVHLPGGDVDSLLIDLPAER